MRPRYEYYLCLNEYLIPIPVKVWKEGTWFYIKAEGLSPALRLEDEYSLYSKFEKELSTSIMFYHINGELGKIFPEYRGAFYAETARLVAFPCRPWYKELWNKFQQRWKRLK